MIDGKCDNGCKTSELATMYTCSHCKKEICRRCLGFQTGHHFVIHNYCKSCYGLLLDREIGIDDHMTQ